MCVERCYGASEWVGRSRAAPVDPRPARRRRIPARAGRVSRRASLPMRVSSADDPPPPARRSTAASSSSRGTAAYEGSGAMPARARAPDCWRDQRPRSAPACPPGRLSSLPPGLDAMSLGPPRPWIPGLPRSAPDARPRPAPGSSPACRMCLLQPAPLSRRRAPVCPRSVLPRILQPAPCMPSPVPRPSPAPPGFSAPQPQPSASVSGFG